MNRKVCSLLGLAMRAGKLKIGEDAVLQAIRGQQAQLVLIAGDCSANTTKKVTDKCKFYHVVYRIYATRAQLGPCIGQDERVSIAILDKGFAKAIIQQIDTEEEVNPLEKRNG